MAIGTNIGDQPIEFYDNMVDSDGTSAKKFTDIDFNNEAILLSFIHVDFHDTSPHWMDNLINLQNDVKVIAVIFNNTGSVTQFDVTKPGGINFQLILNNNWLNPNYNPGGNSFAQDYFNGIINDTAFPGPPSGEVASYLLTKDHNICDKWHKDSTTNLNPISFKKIKPRLTLTPSGFATGDNTITFNPAITGQDLSPIPCEIIIKYDGVATYSYIVNTVDPRIISVTPASGSILSAAQPISILFSENVIGADNPANYTLSGGLAQTVDYSGNPDFDSADFANTEYYIRRRLQNLNANPRIMYTVPSIGNSVNLTDLNDVDVLFSKPVNIANTQNTINYPLAGGAGNLQLDGVTPVTYDYLGQVENKAILKIILSGGSSIDQGTIQIDVNKDSASKIGDGTNILDGNYGQQDTIPEPFYTISYNGPEVETIVDDPAALITDFASFTNPINVTFTDPVTKASSPGTDLDSSNFAIDTSSLTIASGTAPVIGGITKVSNSQYDITLNNLTGLEASGSFNITLSDIADNYGNALGGTTTITYTVDTVAPALAPVTIASDNLAPAFAKIGDTITVSFTSNEDIQTPTVTIAGQPATVTGGPTAWTAEYTMQASDTEGAVGFVISAIQDTLGNPSGNVTGTTDASSVTFYKPSPSITGSTLQGDNSYIIVTLNRGVYSAIGATGVLANTDLSLTFIQNSGTATDASIASVFHTAGTASVQVNLSIAGTPSGVETIEIQPVANSVYDAAGNPALDTDTTGAVILNAAGVAALTLNPVTISSSNSAPSFAKVGDTITVSFASSEDIQTPTVTIAGQAATVTGGPQVWSAAYTMQSADTEGVVGFVISAIQDTLGNAASDVTGTTDTSSVIFSKTDLINPVAGITSDISGTTDISPIPVTITFSREVVGFDAGDITTGNCTVTNFIEVTSQRVWTADIVPDSQGELSLYIDQDAVQDTSGNGNFKTQTLYIIYTGAVIDTVPPRVLSVKINPHLDQ